jgi:hypothetical protein
MLYPYWTLEDALAQRCPVEHVGCLRPPDGLWEPAPLDLRSHALANLARLAMGEGRPAVEACVALLANVSRETSADNTQFPPWVTARRLAYQEAQQALPLDNAPTINQPAPIDRDGASVDNVLTPQDIHRCCPHG